MCACACLCVCVDQSGIQGSCLLFRHDSNGDSSSILSTLVQIRVQRALEIAAQPAKPHKSSFPFPISFHNSNLNSNEIIHWNSKTRLIIASHQLNCIPSMRAIYFLSFRFFFLRFEYGLPICPPFSFHFRKMVRIAGNAIEQIMLTRFRKQNTNFFGKWGANESQCWKMNDKNLDRSKRETEWGR